MILGLLFRCYRFSIWDYSHKRVTREAGNQLVNDKGVYSEYSSDTEESVQEIG